MEFWYKLPDRYLKTQSVSGRVVQRLSSAGGRGTWQVVRPQGDIVLPRTAAAIASNLAPFAVFHREGELQRQASRAQVTSVAADGGPGDAALVLAEVTGATSRQRWLLHLGGETKLPIRVEYERDALESAGWELQSRLVFENLEYDLPVPDSLFDLSRSE